MWLIAGFPLFRILVDRADAGVSHMGSTYSYTEKKRIRKNFGKLLSAIEVPSLLAIQQDSYRKFLNVDGESSASGLHSVFASVFPISSLSG
jgi:DNA-directed RNA polymerase subunit beta